MNFRVSVGDGSSYKHAVALCYKNKSWYTY